MLIALFRNALPVGWFCLVNKFSKTNSKDRIKRAKITEAEHCLTNLGSFVGADMARAEIMDRGMSNCAKKLPYDNLWNTTNKLRNCLNNETSQPIVLTTGFYIKSVGKTETDGPPGAMVLARTLSELYPNRDIIIISDDIKEDVVKKLVEKEHKSNIKHVYLTCRPDERYPYKDSEEEAKKFISKHNPQAFISVEKLSLVVSKFTVQTTSGDGSTVTTSYVGSPIWNLDGSIETSKSISTGTTVSTKLSDGNNVMAENFNGIVTNERCYLSKDENKSRVNVNAHHSVAIALAFEKCYQDERILTVGIGDGGNELGFGKSACNLPKDKQIPRSTSPADFEIPAITSNFGALGLSMALCCLEDKMNLIPGLISSNHEYDLIKFCVDNGAVDGLALKDGEITVDGYSDFERNNAYGKLKECFMK